MIGIRNNSNAVLSYFFVAGFCSRKHSTSDRWNLSNLEVPSFRCKLEFGIRKISSYHSSWKATKDRCSVLFSWIILNIILQMVVIARALLSICSLPFPFDKKLYCPVDHHVFEVVPMRDFHCLSHLNFRFIFLWIIEWRRSYYLLYIWGTLKLFRVASVFENRNRAIFFCQKVSECYSFRCNNRLNKSWKTGYFLALVM